MRWTLLFIPLFIIGCSVDELPPCEGVGMEGEICKEYQYVFGSYNGVNEYEYDLGTNLLSKVTTKRKNGSTEGVTKYGYNADGLITSIVLEDSKGKVLSEKTTTYNSDQNVLLETLIGQTNSQTESNYEGSLLKAVSYKNEGVIEWVDSLEYYSGTNDLYRKLRFREGVLSEILFYESYANNIKEERLANANGVVQSKKITRFDDAGNLVEELNYSAGNVLLTKTVFEHLNGVLDKVEKFNESGEEFEELNYQRF